MAGWDEASIDDLLADPITRDLMAADGVELGELRVLLSNVQRTIERYAASEGRPTSLACFAQLYSAQPKAAEAQPMLPAPRGNLADGSRSSMSPLAWTLCGQTGALSGAER